MDMTRQKNIDETVEDTNSPVTLFGYVVPGYYERNASYGPTI